jgi:uncharacterized protein
MCGASRHRCGSVRLVHRAAILAPHTLGRMSDVVVVEAIYAAMATADFDRLFELVDPAVVITQDDRLPWGGRYEGHDGLATFAIALRGAIESAVEIQAIFAADDEVIQCGRTRGTTVAGGTPFDIAEVHRWTIRGGRAVAAHFAIDTEAMLAVLG